MSVTIEILGELLLLIEHCRVMVQRLETGLIDVILLHMTTVYHLILDCILFFLTAQPVQLELLIVINLIALLN